MASVRAWVLAAVLLVPALPAGASGAVDANCSGSEFSTDGFAPLSVTNSNGNVNSNGFGSYCLYHAPGFPFHGDLTVELFDSLGQRAYAVMRCGMSGLEPLGMVGMGCRVVAQSQPALVAGTMRLVGTAGPTPDGIPAFGGWKVGVVFGG